MGRVEIVNTNGLSTTVNGQLSGGPNAVNVASASGDFATTGLAMGFQPAVPRAASARVASFSSASAQNAAITMNGQILTASGINSDQIAGSGTTAGIVITLADHSKPQRQRRIVQDRTELRPEVPVRRNANQGMSIVPDRVSSKGLGVGGLSVATQSAAESAIAALDQAIQVVSRSNMGAMINASPTR